MHRTAAGGTGPDRPAPTPLVTAVRAKGAHRVAVELDGHAWRTLPLDAVAAAGVTTGVPLDRQRARELSRALRRARAIEAAGRALRYADHTRASLDRRLLDRGVAASERAEALRVVEGAGLVDDARYAERRAGMLAARGYGNAAIASELERRGIEGHVVHDALAVLEPEWVRARKVAEDCGGGARAARTLAARGFDADAIEAVVAVDEADGIG